MSQPDDCDHGFPDRKYCAECMSEGNIEPRRVTVKGHPFAARYDGECALCTDPILSGQLIWSRTDNTHIHYRHAPRSTP